MAAVMVKLQSFGAIVEEKGVNTKVVFFNTLLH